MNEKLQKTLEDIGLSEHEARVYLATLSLGPSTVLKISRGSGIKRTTVYSIIDSLKQKGLIAVELRGLKQLYVAENPERLDTVMNSRREAFAQQLPEFLALYNLKEGESVMKYYDGLEAVKNVYEQLLSDARLNEDYLVVSNVEEWERIDPKYFNGFLERRAKKGIAPRVLFQDSPRARKQVAFDRNYNTKTKILPEGTRLRTSVIITPRRVVIHQLTPPVMAIVIETKSVIEMQTELFNIIWNTLPNEGGADENKNLSEV